MEQKNFFVALILSTLIILGYQHYVQIPQMKAAQAQREAAAAQNKTASGSLTPNVPAAKTVEALPRAQALQQQPRVMLENDKVAASINLQGGRLDDVSLKNYRETIDKNSDNIKLLSPSGSQNPYYVELGWLSDHPDVALPGAQTQWQLVSKDASEITLSWHGNNGLEVVRHIHLDDAYGFTMKDTLVNKSNAPVSVYPYGLVSKTGYSADTKTRGIHEGLIGVFNDRLVESDYKVLNGDKGESFTVVNHESNGGWVGVSDKYWLTALVPAQDSHIKYRFSHRQESGNHIYQSDYLGQAVSVPPQGSITNQTFVFSGAKEVSLLDRYQAEQGAPHFDLAIDFGWFYFLTKPFFYILTFLYQLVGNFGVALVLLTVIVRSALFPLANKSYRSMNRLKEVQPQMKAIMARHKDDRNKLNEEMMKFYKKEKVNPTSGCLPILLQMPVFFALYKVLSINIEMRHAPFFGWIQDLSAPDPTHIFNLFGLIPWTPPSFLGIGLLPIIMGITMFFQQRLGPKPNDPAQEKMFKMFPIIFTFLLAHFPAGLVIYWTCSNLLSILQQAILKKGPKKASQK